MRPAELARAIVTLARTFGWDAGRHRLAFEVRRAASLLRASPRAVPTAVGRAPLPPGWPFVPDAARLRHLADRERGLERARRVLAGEHHAYRARWAPRPATADAWSGPEQQPWCDPLLAWFRVPHVASDGRDIKDVWEAGRFAWAYDLSRGWMLTGDDAFARELWTSLERFIDACPPFRGPQWACGQETAIRAIALAWTEGALLDAPSSTAERLASLRTLLAWSAERIADAIAYARSQRNNHGISEATALILIGARLAAVHPHAPRWIRIGHRALERQIRDQLAEDGWYIQHSFTYHRLALDQLVVAQRALASTGLTLSDSALACVRASVRVLAEVADSESGDVPNHGPNDGAHVLPLSAAGYRDFRPAITAAAATFGVAVRADLPTDPETLAWLSLPEPPRTEPRALPAVASGASGWAHVVTSGARVFCRAGSYRSRPGHIDPLHVDVWIDGQPVAVDAGTFRYAAPAPWRNALGACEVHNTVTIEGHPPARRGPRFLWLSWPDARILEVATDDANQVRIAMENRSWVEQGIDHRRTCLVGAHGVVVVDELSAAPTRPVVAIVHWLLHGDAAHVALASTGELDVDIVRGDPTGVRGWSSDHYSVRQPATSVRARVPLDRGRVRIVSGFGDRRSPELLAAIAHGRALTLAGETSPCCT